MNINLDFIKFNTNIHLPNKSANISFKAAASPKNDTFERTSALKNIDMTVYNPFDNVTCTNSVRVDLSKPQKIHLKSNKPVTKYRGFIPRVEIPDIELDYNPKRTGVIWDKEKNKPIKVVILKSSKGKNDTAYHFMSPNLKKEYGYSDYAVSKKLHTSTSYTTRWKKHNSIPSLNNLIILAEIFHVSLDYLLGRTDYKH